MKLIILSALIFLSGVTVPGTSERAGKRRIENIGNLEHHFRFARVLRSFRALRLLNVTKADPIRPVKANGQKKEKSIRLR